MHPAISSHWGLNRIKTGLMMMMRQRREYFDVLKNIIVKVGRIREAIGVKTDMKFDLFGVNACQIHC